MTERTCNLEQCNRPHAGKGLCNLHYQRQIAGKPLEAPEPVEHETCTVEGCNKPPRSRLAALCPMHYHRQYRHGSVSMVATESGVSVSHGRRYKTVYRPRHPLASKYGNVYVHRMVLFDAIGYGPHPCHWCQRSINWTAKGDPNELQPDHLNGYGDDNRLENLVPPCRTCNSGRASQHKSAALRDAGFWSVNDTIAHLTNRSRVDPIEQAS